MSLYWINVNIKEFLNNTRKIFTDEYFDDEQHEVGFAEICNRTLQKAINKSSEHNLYLYGLLAKMANMEKEWEQSESIEPIIYEMAEKVGIQLY
jgi:hypothetical protein